MGLFSKKAKVDPAEIADLHSQLEALHQRLAASESARELLEARVVTLNDTTNVLGVTTAALNARSHEIDEMTQRMAEVEVIKRQVAHLDVVNAKLISLESLNGKLADLADRVNTTTHEAKSAKDHAATLDDRVSNLSREFANQLGELSHELDQLSAAKPTMAPPVFVPQQVVTEDMIEQLHDGQVRLANEQARYEIAFRQDLALLADHFRRSRPS